MITIFMGLILFSEYKNVLFNVNNKNVFLVYSLLLSALEIHKCVEIYFNLIFIINT